MAVNVENNHQPLTTNTINISVYNCISITQRFYV